jgi:hypothetical protein
VTTKTEQNNGIAMFNTGNEGTGGLRISYSSRIQGLNVQCSKKNPIELGKGGFLAYLAFQSIRTFN